jgi:hypothetical protein
LIALQPTKTVLFVLLSGLVLVALSACGGGNARQIELAPASALPPDIQQTAPQFQEAYRFAIANPELLSQFPCYCGCGGMGHQNNYDCYVQEVLADGSIIFEPHASL